MLFSSPIIIITAQVNSINAIISKKENCIDRTDSMNKSMKPVLTILLISAAITIIMKIAAKNRTSMNLLIFIIVYILSFLLYVYPHHLHDEDTTYIIIFLRSLLFSLCIHIKQLIKLRKSCKLSI